MEGRKLPWYFCAKCSTGFALISDSVHYYLKKKVDNIYIRFSENSLRNTEIEDQKVVCLICRDEVVIILRYQNEEFPVLNRASLTSSKNPTYEGELQMEWNGDYPQKIFLQGMLSIDDQIIYVTLGDENHDALPFNRNHNFRISSFRISSQIVKLSLTGKTTGTVMDIFIYVDDFESLYTFYEKLKSAKANPSRRDNKHENKSPQTANQMKRSQCPTCKKVFDTVQKRCGHQRHCGKGEQNRNQKDKANLTRRSKSNHTTNQPERSQCPTCKKNFKSVRKRCGQQAHCGLEKKNVNQKVKANPSRRSKSIHTTKQPERSQCPTCKKVFKSVRERCGHQTHCGKQNLNQKGKNSKAKEQPNSTNDTVVHNDSVTLRIQKQIEQQKNIMMEPVVENEMVFQIDSANYSVGIHEIAADGNCLFSSLFHQHSNVTKSGTVQDFRKEIVNEIRSNESYYENYLNGHLYETDPQIWDLLNDVEKRTKRNELVGNLERDNFWGGGETRW